MTRLTLRTVGGVVVSIDAAVVAEAHARRGAGGWRLGRLAERRGTTR